MIQPRHVVAILALVIPATAFARPQQGAQTAGQGADAQVTFPKPTATTPSGCLDEVRAYAAARQKEVPPADDAAQALTRQQRTALLQQINASRQAMAKACAAKFDAKTVDAAQLAPLVQLDGDANLLDQAQAAIDRGLPMRTMAPADRAAFISAAIPIIRRTAPPKADRPWRVANQYPKIETLVDELDGNAAATFDQKWSIHSTMESLYRGDDIDAGIIKHGNWILAAAKGFTAAERAKYGRTVVSAHVYMAEAYAGQAVTDTAIRLLEDARTHWSDVTGIDELVGPTLARYRLVGTPGAAITAPIWLNAPAGTRDLAMPGAVTLLEFTAHWCGPCRESYPGINRLRERFKGRNFRVVLATRLWGSFGSEGNLPADAEIARDTAYFAEHRLDVPVAIGESRPIWDASHKVGYPNGEDPNETAYKVLGIPQLQLIDQKGVIRLIMIGYDNANEARLAATIEALLKEH